MDPDIAERLMQEGTLRGEEVEVSILFLDIRDFTAFAERFSALRLFAPVAGRAEGGATEAELSRSGSES